MPHRTRLVVEPLSMTEREGAFFGELCHVDLAGALVDEFTLDVLIDGVAHPALRQRGLGVAAATLSTWRLVEPSFFEHPVRCMS